MCYVMYTISERNIEQIITKKMLDFVHYNIVQNTNLNYELEIIISEGLFVNFNELDKSY